MTVRETIAAVATPPGVGGVGIIRISGPRALEIGESITAGKLPTRQILLRRLFDENDKVLDQAICFYCPAPQSFTGENVVELQAHGGPVLLDMLLERICQLGGRLAQGGEFSQRAFLNGKLDLTQAEAISDLIDAGSRAAVRAAMRSLQGEFSSRIRELAGNVVDLRVFIESALDFAEEEIDFLADTKISEQLLEYQNQLASILAQAEQGRVLNEGLSLVLAGLPNAGKSSLLNYLAGYEAAIVTDIPGTTRDVLHEQISLKGIPVRVRDTAGLRISDNPVEQAGIKRAWQEISHADTVLLLVDSGLGITAADRAIIEQLGSTNYHLVYSKADLLTGDSPRHSEASYISVYDGEGLDELIDQITGQLIDYNQGNQTILARRRHVVALENAYQGLVRASQEFAATASTELIAEDLRQVQQCLNEITGEFSSEDLLGAIFSSFCIGK
ncbi:MAG: tRNA uridine-5-carboxymethylaminomethyl(34) synthesis GTPase MnmE [Gammaproteobacteria bacterium]|nr:tRNA uridine-5-carboxymethylaminomethyl(34) synthesis GTPase MnmE [Gammaproteobacteria bacterium]